MRRFVVILVLLGVLVLGPPADAAWSPSRIVAMGIDPILGAGRSGAAAIVTTGLNPAEGDVGTERLTVMAPGGRFGPARRLSPVQYTAQPRNPCQKPPLRQTCTAAPTDVSVPTAQAVAILYADADERGNGAPPAQVQILKGRARGGVIYPLVGVGQGTLTQGALASTADGVVVAAANVFLGYGAQNPYRVGVVNPDGGGLSSQQLVGFGDVSLNHPDLVTDDDGGAFLYPNGYGSDCWSLAYRPPGGAFRINYASRPCARHHVYNLQGGFAVSGNGDDALLSLSSTPAQAAEQEQSLTLQVGRFGALGEPLVIEPNTTSVTVPLADVGGNANPPFSALSADADGALTLAWWNCGDTLSRCAVQADTATMHGRLGRPSTLAANAIQFRAADGAVAWEACGPRHRCRISAAVVLAGDRFTAPQRLGAGFLVTVRDDRHGDALAVWDAPGGRVQAALRPACARRFGPTRTLSKPGVSASTIRAVYSTEGTAVVAWSENGRTSAAISRRPSCAAPRTGSSSPRRSPGPNRRSE